MYQQKGQLVLACVLRLNFSFHVYTLFSVVDVHTPTASVFNECEGTIGDQDEASVNEITITREEDKGTSSAVVTLPAGAGTISITPYTATTALRVKWDDWLQQSSHADADVVGRHKQVAGCGLANCWVTFTDSVPQTHIWFEGWSIHATKSAKLTFKIPNKRIVTVCPSPHKEQNLPKKIFDPTPFFDAGTYEASELHSDEDFEAPFRSSRWNPSDSSVYPRPIIKPNYPPSQYGSKPESRCQSYHRKQFALWEFAST